MIKENKIKLIITSVITMLPVLIGLTLWGRLPGQIPTHWNAAGEIDGWSSKAFAVFGIPAILLGVHLLCMIITSMDPKNKNITSKPLNLIFWLCPVMSVVLGSCTYAVAMGIDVNVGTLVPAFIGVMFVVIGNYLPKCQPNYTVGIKIPWTLHSEENWNATHRFAGPVWVIGGILLTATAIFDLQVIFAVLLLLIAFIPMIYSYMYYKKHS